MSAMNELIQWLMKTGQAKSRKEAQEIAVRMRKSENVRAADPILGDFEETVEESVGKKRTEFKKKPQRDELSGVPALIPGRDYSTNKTIHVPRGGFYRDDEVARLSLPRDGAEKVATKVDEILPSKAADGPPKKSGLFSRREALAGAGLLGGTGAFAGYQALPEKEDPYYEPTKQDLLDYVGKPPQKKEERKIARADSDASMSGQELDTLAATLKKRQEEPPPAPVEEKAEAAPAPAEKPAAMAEQIQRNIVAGASSTSSEAGSDPMSKREKSDTLEQMKNLAEQYKRNTPKSQYDEKSLADAINKAKELYKEQSTRNEWLEVAQMLGRAGTQFAAAAAGKRTGIDMSNLEFGQGIDYGARTERARRDYQQEVENIEKGDTRRRLSEQEADKERADQYKRDFEPLEYQFRSEEAEKQRKNMRDLYNIRAGEKTGGDDDKVIAQADRYLSQQEDDVQREVTSEQKKIDQELSALEAAASGDLDSKVDKELQKKNPKFAKYRAQLDATKTLNPFDDEEPKRQAVIEQAKADLMTRIRPLMDRRKQLAEQRAQLISRELTPQDILKQNKQPSTAPQQEDSVITVRGPSGETAQMRKSVFESKYSKQPGYSIVGH